MSDRRERARTSLLGLAVGDALGESFFGPPDAVRARIAARAVPAGPLPWTDDTQMATALLRVLEASDGRVTVSVALAAFVDEFEIRRGYGSATRDLILEVRLGADGPGLVREAFGGAGSWGNGAAMRAAPIGAWHADDLELAAHLSRVQASATHGHPDAAEGAAAVAVAAGLLCTAPDAPPRGELLTAVAGHCRPGRVRDALHRAASLGTTAPETAAAALGSGQDVSAVDTVPFALWCATGSPDDLVETFWSTVAGLGDRDTTCAIACSVVAPRVGLTGIPAEWVAAVEEVRWPDPDR